MYNKATIMGRIGNLDSRFLPSGVAVVDLSVATNKKYKDKEGIQQDKTTWHKVSAFAKTAELISKYCNKGDLILVEGEIDNQEYTDQQGVKKYVTKILCQTVKFMPKNNTGGQQPQNQSSNQSVPQQGFTDDSVPF